MINNSNPTHKIQIVSFEKYLQDMWVFAIIFVIFLNETIVSTPLLWIILQFITVFVANYIFSKSGPNILVALGLPTVLLTVLLLFGIPIWLYVISALISAWSLHARYNLIQSDPNSDSPYSLVFFATFLSVHFLCYLLAIEDYKLPLYSVFIGGVIFFAGARLFNVQRTSHKQKKESFLKVSLFYMIGIIGVFLLTLFTYFLTPPIRTLFNWVFQGILAVVMIPLMPLLNVLEKFLSGLTKEPTEEEQKDVGANGAMMEDLLPNTQEASSYTFNFEWIVLGVIGLAIFGVIAYLISKKIEQSKEKASNDIIYKNEELVVPLQEESSSENTLYRVESSFLRELYLSFEKEANSFGFEREKSETVREWFQRMQWLAKDEFFFIYEEVRYGGHTVKKDKAELYVQEIEKIKKLFLQKEV